MDCRRDPLRFRWFLLVINLLSVVASIGLIVMSVTSFVKCKELSPLLHLSGGIIDLMVTSISVSSISSVLALFAVFTAIRTKWLCPLLWVSILSVVLFLSDMTVGILLVREANNIPVDVQVDLNRTFPHYGLDGGITQAWDDMHKGFNCCGINNYTDFIDYNPSKKFPPSCCVEAVDVQSLLPLVSRANCSTGYQVRTTGCSQPVLRELQISASKLGTYQLFRSIVFLTISILSVVVARNGFIYSRIEKKRHQRQLPDSQVMPS